MHAGRGGGGTAHIVPVPGVMGVKDFALNYRSFLERYKFERFDRIFDKGKIIDELYVGELLWAELWEIKFMAREEGNGFILMSKQPFSSF